MLQGWSREVATETLQPGKPEAPSIRLFTEEICQPTDLINAQSLK